MSRLIPIDRMKRVVGAAISPGSLSPGVKAAIFFSALAVLTALVAWLDPRPNLRHMRVTMLSGSTAGNYFATVEKLAAEAARHGGHVRNISTAGSVENVRRLIDDAASCKSHFALVQGGIDYPNGHKLEVLGRLPRPESLMILGRGVERIRVPADLKALRLGIGPVGSGTEQVMRRVLSPLRGLDLVVSTQSVERQLEMLQRGELDLAAMVIDDEAMLLADAVTKRGLDILQVPDVESLARRLPFARVGVIQAGQLDYVRQLPREDKQVLQIEALIIGNGCASNGATQGMLSTVAEVFPAFVTHNKGQANLSGLPMSTVAKNFYNDEGPDVLGEYAPWAVNIMPLPTWIQLGVALSLLFSGMALWHRFRLWRLDADRIKIEREIPALFSERVTVGSIAKMPYDPGHLKPESRAQIDGLIARLSALSARCRKQSISVLTPMGEEMSYRYQEALMADLLNALRQYKAGMPAPDSAPSVPSG